MKVPWLSDYSRTLPASTGEMEKREKEEPGWLEEMERDINIEVADYLRQLKKPSN